MAAITRTGRTTQLALYGERLAAPSWSNLPEPVRLEALALLAQLLASVRMAQSARASQDQGGHDE